MSAAVTSVFILSSSVVLLLFWLRSTLRAILNQRFEEDFNAGVAASVPLQWPGIREQLAADPTRVNDSWESVRLLEQDYRALTYLLHKTQPAREGRCLYTKGLLMLDYKLLRLWVRLKSFLALDNWRTSLQEMVAILEYFGNVVGQRHQASISAFQPLPAMAGGVKVPLLDVCAYCRNVHLPNESDDGRWVHTDRYYAQGGSNAVLLSHGICPDCYDHLVKPSLNGR